MEEKYELIVGLEVHIQLNTDSKAYCTDEYSFGSEPNSSVSPVSAGHPGTLPVPNIEVFHSAIQLGLALKCQITRTNEYARKNYFYADLPKGYQITQDTTPICTNGRIVVKNGNLGFSSIGITRIHMEEDTGKSIHDIDPQHSLIDLNRAGVPLLEVVTEPDFRTIDEVYDFLTQLRKIVQYLDISDGNMEEGSLRCDANISVRKFGEKGFRQRVEVKNLNSFRQVQRAILYERDRQIVAHEAGETVAQETRNFLPKTGETILLRSKENAHDYRYFPEPDIAPVIVGQEWVDKLKTQMPVLPVEWENKFMQEYKLSTYDIQLLLESKEMAEYYDVLVKHTSHFKTACNYINGFVKSYLNEHAITINQFPLSALKIAAVVNLVENGSINHNSAQETLLPYLIKNSTIHVEEAAKELNLLQSKDEDELKQWILQAFEEHPEEYQRLKQGDKKLIGVFIGAVRKISKGKADPRSITQVINQLL